MWVTDDGSYHTPNYDIACFRVWIEPHYGVNNQPLFVLELLHSDVAGEQYLKAVQANRRTATSQHFKGLAFVTGCRQVASNLALNSFGGLIVAISLPQQDAIRQNSAQKEIWH